MQNNIVVHIGGSNARKMYAALDPDIGKNFDSNLISITTNAKWEEIPGKYLLIILGTPLPPITKIPESWKEAVDELSQYDGAFNFIYWDQIEGKIIVCTDFLGLQPIYWKKDSDGIFLSSHTKVYNTTYDPAGWGAFLSLGYSIGNQTLTKGVERVPAACVLIVDIETQTMNFSNYWNLTKRIKRGSLSDVYGALDDSMDKAIAAVQFDQTLLMSGGFDSRLIACLLKQKRQHFRAIIVSHYDENMDADAIFAKAMAKILKVTYDFHIPDKNYFSSTAYLNYLFASDSETPSLYLFISQVMQFVPHNTVWDGILPGGTLKGREGGFKLFFSRRGSGFDSKVWKAAKTIFCRGVAEEMWESFQQIWEKETSRYSDDSDGTTQFFLEHRIRNRIGPNPFKIFQQKAQVLSAGMTRNYIERAMGIPYEEKKNHKFYRDIFGKYFPEATKIPIVHGSTIEHVKGVPMFSYFLFFISKIYTYLQMRPRLMKFLHMEPAALSFLPSRFLSLPSLIDEPDPVLNEDFLRSLHYGEQLPPEFKRLLFHWRIWRWLHNGNFYERLRESRT